MVIWRPCSVCGHKLSFFSEIIVSYCRLDRLKAAYISLLVLEDFKYGMP